MRRFSILLTAVLTLAAARPLVAHSAEVAWRPLTEPIILGEVVDMNAHLVRVRTGDGEVLPLEFDSRTVMSSDLAPGTPVRVEFRMLDNGAHLAQRVTPIEKGSLDWDTFAAELGAGSPDESREQPMAETRASGQGDIRVASLEGEPRSDTDTGASASHASNEAAKPGQESTEPSDSADGNKRMPDTASPVPTVLAVGLLLLAGAGSLWWGRRRAS